MKDQRKGSVGLTRRDTLGLIVGASALLVGCESTKGTADAATNDLSATPDGAGTCAETPEGEIGPYFSDDSATGFNRSNLLTNLDGTNAQTGIQLALTVTVVDTEKSCAPYVGAQIDIWSCNPSGVYSDQASESTSTEQWLRGYQLTNASGQVTFVTLIPGWYSGRTTHIHLRIRSSYSEASSTSDGTNTTQLFFNQAFVDNLATSVAPYDAEGTNPTTNASDRVYSEQVKGANVLTLAGSATAGYAASITIGLPIAAATSTTPGGPGDGGMTGGPPNDDGGPPNM